MIRTLQQLYFDQINNLYSAENQMLKILPQMAVHASDPDLREAFGEHFEETRKHCARLEIISDRHGLRDEPVTCEAMKEMLLEIRHYLAETVPGDVRDAVLIVFANRIEHYEIAGYGMVTAFAKSLGFGADADLLDETLKEERSADALITKIATGGILRSGGSLAAADLL